jgi:hypothetical protein
MNGRRTGQGGRIRGNGPVRRGKEAEQKYGFCTKMASGLPGKTGRCKVMRVFNFYGKEGGSSFAMNLIVNGKTYGSITGEPSYARGLRPGG